MRLGLSVAGLVVALSSVASTVTWAGDDGSAPLWQGIGSIFGPVLGFGSIGGEKDPIDYHEHGKIVVPPTMDLPPPGSAASATADWPVNQEVIRKKAAKDAKKKEIAGVGDARLRYTHPFPPNTPVTVKPADSDLGASCGASGNCASSPSPGLLGNLNPLSWVGMGKSVPLGPEPDREWLTDPPKGFRAPLEPTAAPVAPTAN
jgi:hypothetical protein